MSQSDDLIQQLIEKLSDTMDPDNARAFVAHCLAAKDQEIASLVVTEHRDAEAREARLRALLVEWRERARRVRPLESEPITADKRKRIQEWMCYTNRANELDAALAISAHLGEAKLAPAALAQSSDDPAVADAKRWLNDAGRAYAPCVQHQPDAWQQVAHELVLTDDDRRELHRQMDKTAAAALGRLSIALYQFAWDFAESLRIPELLAWLSRRFQRSPQRGPGDRE
jgi:hypothetical protein